MDSELIRLNTSENLEELRSYVNQLDISTVTSEISQLIQRNDGAVVIHILLSNLSNNASSQQKKLQVAELILSEMEKQETPARIGEKLMTVLAGQVDSFPTSHLLRLVDICLNMIQRPSLDSNSFPCWKELLPRLLQLVVEKSDVEHAGSQMSGEKYKNSIVSTVCLADWPDSIIVDLAAMFVDMPMRKEEKLRVVRKFCSVLPSMPGDLLPPLTHHLLHLTRNELALPFLLVLAQYFNDNLYSKMDAIDNGGVQGANAHRRYSEVEGTLVYHAVQSQVCVSALKQCLQSPEVVLQPFLVTLLLAGATVAPSSDEPAVTVILPCLARAFLENERLAECAWLRSVSPPPLQVHQTMTYVLENCYRGRDSVLKGLVSLGVALTGGGRSRTTEDAADKLRSLGLDILEDLVKRHRLVTSTVLQSLGNLISQAQDAQHYTECLVKLSHKQPLKVLDCSNVLVQLLDNLSSRLSPTVLSQILSVLLHLSRLSPQLRDNLVIVLRKSLFPQDTDRRIMAVKGFLELLSVLKISNLLSLSQSMSQNYCNFTQICSQSLAVGGAQSNEGLCLEVLSILREVFKQQHQVKTVLYRGIYKSVRANPVLAPHVLDHLQTHLDKFCENGDANPPILFQNAVAVKGTEIVLLEPLGDLILCVGLLAAKLEDGGRSVKLQELMTSLCEKMAKCEVASFHLHSDDLGITTESSLELSKLQITAEQILGVYEALMGHVLCSWKKGDGNQATLLWNLFKGYTCLSDYLRGLGKVEKKRGEGRSKKTKPFVFKFPPTVLNLKCVTRLLCLINEVSVNWATAEASAPLRGKRELHRYALQTAVTTVQQISALPPIEMTKDCLVIGYLCKIGRTLYTKCVCSLSEMKGFDLKCAATGLQLFSDLLTLILSHFRSKLQPFLSEIAGVIEEQNPLQVVISALLDQIEDVLCDEEEEDAKEDLQAKKMSALYLSVLGSLVSQLPSGTPYVKEVYEKVKEFCKITAIEKAGVAKPLLSLLLSLHRHCEESNAIIRDLALCLCDSMALIDDEMQVEEHTKYKVINQRTSNVCLVALCQSIQLILADIEFVVDRFKAELVILPLPSPEPLGVRKEKLLEREIDVCRHVDECARAVSALCTIAVPAGVYSDSVLKSLELIYNRLTLLAKYFTVKVAKFDEGIANTKFDKTVRLVDSELTKNMYCFTDHVIGDGPAEGRKVNPTLEKQRAMKQTKLIPKVVLEKEQFHKFLLQLSKRAKVDLASKTKHAMARDYRLFVRQVRDLLEKENAEPASESMETEEITDAESSPPGSPTSKRSRLCSV